LNASANKDEFRAKLKRLDAALQNAEAFVAAGGDLESKEAAPLGSELVSAFADLAKDFGLGNLIGLYVSIAHENHLQELERKTAELKTVIS